MTAEPTLFFELAFDPRYAHLWGEMAQWNAEVAREPEPWGLAGPPPLADLMSELSARLTPEQVVQAERLAWAEYLFRINEGEVTDECSEAGPVGDADVAAAAGGSAVVDDGDRRDPGDPG